MMMMMIVMMMLMVIASSLLLVLQRTLSYPVIASPDQYCDSLLHSTSMTTATHTSLHWGSTWNMNTPLQNLEPGEYSMSAVMMKCVFFMMMMMMMMMMSIIIDVLIILIC